MNNETNQTSVQPQTQEIGILGRIIGVFTSPKKTFESISRKPSWVLPLIILVILSGVMTFIMQPVIITESLNKQAEKMEERGMDQDQIDAIAERTEGMMKITMIPSAIIVTAASLAIGALIWLFVGNVILGGSGKFTQLFSVNIYRSFIPLLGLLIKLPLILSKETLNVHFSLATFMSDELRDTFLYKILASVEVFNIWAIAVLCIGIAVVYKFKTNKVWPIVVIVYAIYFLGSAALSGLF
jgi:hypothetical protein